MSNETVGKRIGDYEILGELGKGGMGKVYKVRNVISDRIEAMKVLLPDLAGQKDLADRFLREIKMLASLDHPNIAALRTAFTSENQLVMIMEYVEGETLSARIEKGPVPVADALKFMDDALAALSYAHQRSIIHRDVKPSNMMITPFGMLKLMDFGIARNDNDQNLTVTGTALGSLNYMSPEQIQGSGVDARSDIYSLGISLYEIVTGKQPFKRDSDFAIMAAHMKETAKRPIELRPDMPQGLNDIILMAMAKDPALRFQSAEAFRGALGSVRESLGVGTPFAAPAGTPGEGADRCANAIGCAGARCSVGFRLRRRAATSADAARSAADGESNAAGSSRRGAIEQPSRTLHHARRGDRACGSCWRGFCGAALFESARRERTIRAALEAGSGSDFADAGDGAAGQHARQSSSRFSRGKFRRERRNGSSGRRQTSRRGKAQERTARRVSRSSASRRRCSSAS